jgi:hypothetical protein
MKKLNTMITMQRRVLSAVAVAMLLGLTGSAWMSAQDKNTTRGGVIGDEVGKYDH